MPRGHKKKKRHNTRDDSQGHSATQDHSLCSSTPVLEDTSKNLVGMKDLCLSTPMHEVTPKNSSASESRSTSQEPRSVPSTITTSEDAAATRCHEGDNRFEEEKFGYSTYLSSTENLCSECLAKIVTFVEQFLLYKFKAKQLITKEDLLDVIGPRHKDKFPEILKRASDRIEVVFAAEVKEIDSTKHLYNLVSQLKLPNNGRVCPGKGLPKTGLLMTLLGMIFMNGNSATEEEIWAFTEIMGVYPGRKHYIFREPKKLIKKDFVRLKYLEYRQVSNSDPPQYEFLWGPRAYIETDKMKVLEFIAKANNAEPSDFSEHYEEALREQAQKAQEKCSQSWPYYNHQNRSMFISTRFLYPNKI
uniref:LOW QUALITY PROTEIN: melanoma-associated antigen B5-like n=1 Tax=Jaculus jaculus TaxID=51337 RepID=UPI00064CE149|nr:LOW QUALITY PROTEIN: melanoma-associated antigen B5-like [Jaculus jaculus]XP_044996455.1 LOW QUALITY PROTEIN: melanoma-associated antigen B5-like [Jaculus jaculus]